MTLREKYILSMIEKKREQRDLRKDFLLRMNCMDRRKKMRDEIEILLESSVESFAHRELLETDKDCTFRA